MDKETRQRLLKIARDSRDPMNDDIRGSVDLDVLLEAFDQELQKEREKAYEHGFRDGMKKEHQHTEAIKDLAHYVLKDKTK